MDCCAAPRRSDHTVDMGHAAAFDLTLAACAACGADWMELHCEAASAGDAVRVAGDVAARMRALPPGAERKAYLKAWLRDHA